MLANWGENQAELVECVDPIKVEEIHDCFWQIHLGIQIQLNTIINFTEGPNKC